MLLSSLTSQSVSKIQPPVTDSAFKLWLVQNKVETKPLEENVFINREKKSYLLLRVILKIVVPFVKQLQYTNRVKINEL